MRKRLYILLLIFFSPITDSIAQIAVESFRLLETDLTANTHGTMEIDQNNEVAALIKVVTTQQGFSFENGMLGIVKVVPHPGEYWVYVPKKTQKITISHPDLGILRDYYFQIPIEGARTYELKLTTGEVITTIKKARTNQYLLIHVTPPEAILYVDDELQPKTEQSFFKLVSLGKHTYRVQAAGYKSTAGVVNVTADERAEVSVELQSLKSTLNIMCDDNKAEIVVNEEVKGQGSWTGALFSGMYIIEARRESHRTVTEEVTLGEMEKKDIKLKAPVPLFGNLRVESVPIGANVFIDGKQYGNTPCILDESDSLLIGNHVVKLSLEGFADTTATITIKENEESVLSDIFLREWRNFKLTTKEDIIDFLKEEKNIELLKKEDNDELRKGIFDVLAKEENYEFFEKEGIYDKLKKVELIREVVETMPEFPGGTQALLRYFKNYLRYPTICQEQGIQGTVVVQFVVDEDGSIVDPEVIRKGNPYLDKEAIRVISNMPRWKPGTQDGKPVRVSFNLPVQFKLSN